MECRPHCGACCIAPSISSPLPGYPNGKPAGVPCPFLDTSLRCTLFGKPERPAVCSNLPPSPAMCKNSAEEALSYLWELEVLTSPSLRS